MPQHCFLVFHLLIYGFSVIHLHLLLDCVHGRCVPLLIRLPLVSQVCHGAPSNAIHFRGSTLRCGSCSLIHISFKSCCRGCARRHFTHFIILQATSWVALFRILPLVPSFHDKRDSSCSSSRCYESTQSPKVSRRVHHRPTITPHRRLPSLPRPAFRDEDSYRPQISFV